MKMATAVTREADAMSLPPKIRGRPRSFDRDAALDRAVELFHRKGYTATSLSDLTAAMGINPPSLYAAFGCKEALFREAVARYRATRTRYVELALMEEPTAHAAVARLLRKTAAALTPPEGSGGCLCILGDQGCEDPELRRFMADLRAAISHALAMRIARGQLEGDVPATMSAGRLARFIATVVQGMSVQARDGADRATLDEIAETALLAWDAAVSARAQA